MSWQGAVVAAREAAQRRAGDVDLRVWVPACADGLLAYLDAAAFAEVLGEDEYLSRVHVCGTDHSAHTVAAAREGRLAAARLRDVDGSVVARAFPLADDGTRGLRDDLRSAVSFARNDIDRDRPLRRIDLIDARGLERPSAVPVRDRLPRLATALRPGGLLLPPPGIDDDEVPEGLVRVRGVDGAWERPERAELLNLGNSWRPSEPIRVLVVNEHELFVRGLGVLLQSLFGRYLDIVAATDEPSQVLALIEEYGPTLVLVDVTGPRSADVPSVVRAAYPHLPVLALAEDPHEAWREVVAFGSVGVVPRSVSADELVGPLLAVAEGLTVLPPEAIRTLVRGVPAERFELLDELDDEELQLWAWVAQGLQDNEIADRLYVSSRTVKRRIGALLRRLDVSRRVEAAELAGRLGLLARVTAAGADDRAHADGTA